MYQKILFLLAVIILMVIQISLINPLSSGLVPLNLVLLLLALFVFQLELIPLLWWSLILGALVDLSSTFPFGTAMVIMIMTSLSLHFLFKNFFTNRSLYTFVLLTMIGTLIYNLLFYLGALLFYSLNLLNYFPFPRNFWSGLLWQTILNIFIAFILFLIAHFIGKRFQKQFLVTK